MRIRTIKPEFFLHEGLFEAERAAKLPLRLAFAGLWCAADREGRFKWEPRKLGIQVLPYDQIDFSAVLDALEACGLIVRYGDNLEFGCVPNFTKHQCVNVREAQSQIPEPPERAHESTVHARAGIERTPNGVNIPVPLRETVFARDGRKCLRCGSESDLTVDHIFPQCMGGTHVLSNLRTLCRPCNSRRPVAGEAFIADLLIDGLTLDDMKVLCMHVHARVEGKGREGNGKEQGTGNKEGKGNTPAPPAWNPSPDQLTVGSWFHRRPTTPWSEKEIKAFKAIHSELFEDGVKLLNAAYSVPHGDNHRTRKDLLTLLNNWQGEIDRWRSYKPPLRSDVQAIEDEGELGFLSNDDAIFHKDKP